MGTFFIWLWFAPVVSPLSPPCMALKFTVRLTLDVRVHVFFNACCVCAPSLVCLGVLLYCWPCRTGRWHSFETMYAQRVVADFDAGTLPLCEGTKLGSLLCNILNCSPS